MTRYVATLIAFLFLIGSTRTCRGATVESALLFHDDFDAHPTWSPAQGTGTLSCKKGDACPFPVPKGYYDYRVGGLQRCSSRDGQHNTLNITDHHPRGGHGKSLQVWNEPCYNEGGSWGSDGLLGVDFPPQSEVYVRYWILFQPDWEWATGSSPQQKFLHLSHYDASRGGDPWDFFSGIQNKPRAIPQLAKWGSGTYRLQLMWQHSPLTSARDSSASFNTNDYFRPKPFDWNSPGAPGDGNWHCLEFYVKLNSAGGAADGISRTWYDGDLVHDAKNVVWVPAGDKPANFKWNHVWLGGNNSNLHKKGEEQWYAIDDFVVSTRYSGPPPRPENLEAEAKKEAAVELNWSAGKNGEECPLDGYRIHYGPAPDKLTSTKNTGRATSCVISDLAPGQTYYFAVTSFNKTSYDARDNESGKSRIISVDLPKRSRH